MNLKLQPGYNTGKFTILEFIERVGKVRKFKVVCNECGRESIKSNGSLWNSVCRGCYKKYTSETLIGRRFGKLIVVEATDIRINDKIVWKCKCDCGNFINTCTTNLTTGDTTTCGCSRSDKVHQTAWRRIYNQYESRARRKGLAFEFNLNEFIELCSSQCYYCGRPPSKDTTHVDVMIKSRLDKYSKKTDDKAIIYHNGIDRVDNNKGYEKDNSVSCCSTCNFAKRGMTILEFYNWINSVYNYEKGRMVK
jgi:hypothetical protein